PVRAAPTLRDTDVFWSVSEADGGTVDSSGNYTAPATEGTYHVVAVSVADTSQSATATVTVTSASSIAVSISPQVASIQTSGSVTFTPTVTGTRNGQSTDVFWSVSDA